MKKILSLFLGFMIGYSETQSADHWFEETLDPKLLIQQVHVYNQLKIDYHRYMANTFLTYKEKSPEEKKKLIREMYGIEHMDDDGNSIFDTGFTDHIDWMKQHANIDMRMKENAKKGDAEVIGYITAFFLKRLDDYIKFKQAILQGMLNNAKRNKKLLRVNSFYKKHIIREYDDFIADCRRFSEKAKRIWDMAQDLNCRDDLALNIVEKRNPIDIFVHVDGHTSPMKFMNFVNIISLRDPEEAENQRQWYIAEMARLEQEEALICLSKDIETTSENAQNLAEVKEEETNSQKKAESETVSCTEVKEPVEEKAIVQEPQQSITQPVQQQATQQQVAQKPSQQPVRKKKESKRELQKRARQQVVDQKVASVSQQSFSSFVDVIPFANSFDHEELGTLTGILAHQRNINWKAFEKMVTSDKGFKGTIYKNKGGSYRTIVFPHPITGNIVQFLVHKPHKSGKEAAVLYHDFMKRVKHHLENQGVINVK